MQLIDCANNWWLTLDIALYEFDYRMELSRLMASQQLLLLQSEYWKKVINMMYDSN